MMQYIYIYILIWSIDFVFVSLFLSISTSFVAKQYMILSFEKYFLVFGCVLENTIENTFSTCCSHFLTFSQLPNKFIISFLNTETKETKPRKKIRQIRSNWEKKEERSAWCCDRRGAISVNWSSVWGLGSLSLSLSLSLSVSLSLSLSPHGSRNGLKWKFSLQTISRSKPSKHMVNWK